MPVRGKGSRPDLVALLASAAHELDLCYPDDSAPIIQRALREAALALHEGREPVYDIETYNHIIKFTKALEASERASKRHKGMGVFYDSR